MICPHCGAELPRVVPSCSLCEREIDIRGIYKSNVIKGDEALLAGEYDKAVISYKKALEFTAGNEDIYLKIGNALNAKGDKGASAMFFKALTYNFYSPRAHELLITLYSKHKKLPDLRAWYQKSAGSAEAEFIEKQIKLIDNIINFSGEQLYAGPPQKEPGLAAVFIKSLKQYMIMNTVIGVILLLVGGGIAAGYFFKLNTFFVVFFSAFFFAATLIMVFVYRIKKIKKSKEQLAKPEEILKDFTKEKNNPPT